MGGPAKVISCLVALGLTYALGYSQGHEDTRVVTNTVEKRIEVPVVKTKIEYREKITPLPEVCYEAYAMLPRITDGNAEQTRATGEILLALQDMGTAAAFNDIHEVNRLVEIVRKEGRVLSSSVNETNQAVITFNSYVNECRDAIAAL